MIPRLIIFDADGTLRRCTVPGQPCPNAPDEWELLPNVRERLASFNWGAPHTGATAFGIVSNQAGVAYGFLDEQTAYMLLRDLVEKAFGAYPGTCHISICPHAIEDDCECRKPKPGLLNRIMEIWQTSPEQTLYIGDMESDQEAADRAGCHFMWAKTFFGWDVEALPDNT